MLINSLFRDYCDSSCHNGFARAALLTFSRHLWYFTEAAVIFSVFFKKVPDSEMKRTVASLMKYKTNEKSLPVGVRIFPVLNQTIKLHQLVGQKSWLSFHLLNQDGDLLKNKHQASEEDFQVQSNGNVCQELKSSK
ncbi:hypothetical protein AVEN_126997-1 [Araneus ventricosus]|uniref:Uncharacterized protein n=1 Tax=Araneus ventricosus TaxID=182803 RepID=A0A4Y2C062_ARAVE|nr:hypothetical protein AVEN_126997-1 [Araneus ventricosus]